MEFKHILVTDEGVFFFLIVKLAKKGKIKQNTPQILGIICKKKKKKNFRFINSANSKLLLCF